MENLSTGQNLGKNHGGSPQPPSPSPYSSQMAPMLDQPDSRGDGEADEEDGNEENDYVGSWQETQQGAKNSQSDNDSSMEDSGAENEEKTSGQDSDEENKEGISALLSKGIGEVEDAARQATGEALKQSWINVWETYGLTFIYINFHYVMAYLGGPFSKYFPKAGREWLARTIMKMPASGRVKKDIEENLGAAIAPFELGLAILVNVLVVVLILAILFVGYVLVTESPASLLYHSVVD